MTVVSEPRFSQATMYVTDALILGSPKLLMFLQPGAVLYSTVYEVLANEPHLSVFRKLVDVVPGMRDALSDPEALVTVFARE
jgi:hypothetical protein